MQTQKATSLTQRTAEALRARIIDGPLQSGEKLPTEKALALEFGVSRTVVREAVAALRADGLIEARHGVGVFVSMKGLAPRQDRLAEVSLLDMLELRMAVEVHAAGLAALRRSWSQEATIGAIAEQFRQAVEDGTPTESLDYAFHRSIAEAANNPAFVDFIDRLGHRAIPRNALVSRSEAQLISRAYLTRVQAEHVSIYTAVTQGNIEASRAAMHAHLAASQARYRGLVDVSTVGIGPGAQD